MNTGLQDAYNLAWKLALVVGGRAEPRLLDSYEEERVPVARRLLETTDRAFMVVVNDSWFVGMLRTHVIARVAAFALGLAPVRRFVFRVVSQIGIHYRDRTLSQSAPGLPDGAPRAGDRFPWLQLKLSAEGPVEDLFRKLDDLRFHLLVAGQPAPVAGDLVQVHAIPSDAANDAELARARIPATSFYLLRPDGHIGLCGVRFDAGLLEQYFSARLGVKRGGIL